MTDSNCPIDLQTRYRIADRDELVRWISLCLAEDILLADAQQCVEALALQLRMGFQSLHERTDGALLLLAESQGLIELLLESSILREVNLPPLLEWMENRARGGS
jgi:hypothetical protein